MSPAQPSGPWWRWAVTGLILAGLALSSYLSWHSLVGGSVLGCDGGSPCDQVLGSRWSSVGGVIPVSGLAAGVYLAMLVASLSVGPATAVPVRRLAWRAMLILVGTAAGSAVWFIGVQKWIVGAFCAYCMATHLIGLTLAALVIWRAPRQVDEGSAARPQRIIGARPAIGLATCGLVLAGIVAAIQVAIKPQTSLHGGAARENLPTIEPHAAPLIGSPEARYLVTLLLDYKCPHCQQLHFLLDEVVRRYGGQLAVAVCPAPLGKQCNPYVEREVEAFNDSCELARIALAVWVAKREEFPNFERWMFTMESGDFWRPRSIEAARSKAVELVGRAAFDAARADPWIDQYLQTSVRIYGDTIANGRGVPKLVFRSHWVIPAPGDADDLVSILQDSLGVPKP
jgi:uncharacterized membrane protein